YLVRKVLAHPIELEAVGRGYAQNCLRLVERKWHQRPYPGADLLRGEFLLKTTDAGLPEFFHVALIQTSILPCLRVGYPQAGTVTSLGSGRNCLTRQRKLAEMMGFSEFCLSEGSFYVRRGHRQPRRAPGHAPAGNPSGRSLL